MLWRHDVAGYTLVATTVLRCIVFPSSFSSSSPPHHFPWTRVSQLVTADATHTPPQPSGSGKESRPQRADRDNNLVSLKGKVELLMVYAVLMVLRRWPERVDGEGLVGEETFSCTRVYH